MLYLREGHIKRRQSFHRPQGAFSDRDIDNKIEKRWKEEKTVRFFDGIEVNKRCNFNNKESSSE